jgi:hypothetical protein
MLLPAAVHILIAFLNRTDIYVIIDSITQLFKDQWLQYTGGEQNSRNTKKLNRICAGYIEITWVGNTECSSVCLRSVVPVLVH